MPSDSVTSLLDSLRQAHILEEKQIEELSSLPGAEPGRLADELVRRQWLTPYQVEQLVEGKGGSLVLGQYILLERLGQGGMGEVFKARHRLMDRVVAVKVIRKDQLANSQAVQRFHREIRAVGQLGHPNVVLAHDADQVGDTHFFVMEYVEGTDLGKVIKQNGPLPAALACEYVRQAALGLQHAHERGLVHRDIKPSNLMLLRIADCGLRIPESPAAPSQSAIRNPQSAIVKILDLGLARLRQQKEDAPLTLTEEGSVMGTPDFMAPEQGTDSHRVDIRADLYSLGCTLFYLLTGRVVFPGETVAAKLYKHWFEEPEAVDRVRPEVPAEVATIVRKLLAKKPDQRYQTPAELAEALAPHCGVGQVSNLPRSIPRQVGNLPHGALPGPEPARFDTMAPSAGKGSGSGSTNKKSWQSATAPDTKPAPAGRKGRGVLIGAALVLLAAIGVGVALLSTSGKTEPQTIAKPDESPAPPVEVVAPPPALTKLKQGEPPAAVAAPVEPAKPAPARVEPFVAAPVPGGPDRFALLVGVTRYESKELAPLPYAETDMVQLAGALQAAGYRSSNITSLTPGQDASLLPQVHNLRRELHRLLRNRLKEDSVVVAFSGQVVQFRGSEECYLCPSDVRLASKQTLVALTEVYNELKACKARFKLLLVDGCRSDALASALPLADELELERVARPQQLPAPEGVAVYFGCSAGETGLDLIERKQGNFFHWTAEGLKQGVPGLEAYVRDRAYAAAFHQQRLRQRPERLGVTGGPAPLAGLESFTAPEPVGELCTLTGHSDAVTALAFAPDGRSVLSGSLDTSVRLWDPEGRRELHAFDPDVVSVVWGVAFAPDGKRLLIGTGGVKEDGRLKPGAAFHNTVRIWDATSRRELKQLQGHGDYVTCVAFAPDGKLVLSGSVDRTLCLWNPQTGKEVQRFRGHTGKVRAVAYAPDGKHVASASDDQTVRLWDPSGKEAWCFTGHTGAVHSVAFSPDGKHILSAADDGTVRLLDRESGNQVRSITGHDGAVLAAVFSPDGQRILSAGADKTVRLWKTATGMDLYCFKGHADAVTAVAFAPDGRRAASAGKDRTVRLWGLPRE